MKSSSTQAETNKILKELEHCTKNKNSWCTRGGTEL